MEIEIPDINDIGWELSMLRQLQDKLENLGEYVMVDGFGDHGDCLKIVEALCKYSGF